MNNAERYPSQKLNIRNVRTGGSYTHYAHACRVQFLCPWKSLLVPVPTLSMCTCDSLAPVPEPDPTYLPNTCQMVSSFVFIVYLLVACFVRARHNSINSVTRQSRVSDVRFFFLGLRFLDEKFKFSNWWSKLQSLTKFCAFEK